MNTLSTLAALTPAYFSAIIAAGALGIACSILSVFVVSKRWAFIGEGIAHAGFGGAGTAWMLALLFPSVTLLTDNRVVYAISIAFCFAVAALVALFTRRSRATVDTVIGIFLVASLAWGFLAYGIYSRATHHFPPQFADYLGFEPLKSLSRAFVFAAVVICLAVSGAVWAFWKELLFYTIDERQAQASGINVPLIHYGLVLLITLVIVVGMQLMGTVLVVALLVLPGATGLLLGKTTQTTWLTSIATGLAGALAGPTITLAFPFIPEGPAIVLTLFFLFLAALTGSKVLGKA